LKYLIFHLLLKPLILNNYRNRLNSAINGDGKYKDEWYWADKLATKHGYYVYFTH